MRKSRQESLVFVRSEDTNVAGSSKAAVTDSNQMRCVQAEYVERMVVARSLGGWRWLSGAVALAIIAITWSFSFASSGSSSFLVGDFCIHFVVVLFVYEMNSSDLHHHTKQFCPLSSFFSGFFQFLSLLLSGRL